MFGRSCLFGLGKKFWLKVAVSFHHFWFQRSREMWFFFFPLYNCFNTDDVFLSINYIKYELFLSFRLAGFHYDACRTGHRPLHPTVQYDSHTVVLDELTLKHVAEDCSSVKSQLLKLKSLLQVPHTHSQMSQICTYICKLLASE